MPTPTTALSYLRPVLRFLQQKDFDFIGLLKKHQVSPDLLQEATARLPMTVSLALMESAQRFCQPEPLWRALMPHVSYEDFGGLGLALEIGGDPVKLLTRLSSYHEAVSDAVSLQLEQKNNGFILHLQPKSGVMPHRQSLLLLLVLLARYFQHQKSKNLSPLCLGIIEPTPEEKQALQDRCGCEVLAADHFYLQFVLQSADQTMVSPANSQTIFGKTIFGKTIFGKTIFGDTISGQAILGHETPVHASLSTPGSSRSTSAQLLQWLQLTMGESIPRLHNAAKALHMSERSLQRRLQAEGLCWSSLVETTRQQLMDPILATPNTPITDVALSLGYVHATSFSRAFRNRYGTTPRNYRKQLILKGTR